MATSGIPGVITHGPFRDGDGPIYFTVDVPTEHGSVVAVDVTYDPPVDSYGVRFSGQVLDAAPEAVTAAIQVTLRHLALERKAAV